MKAKDGQEAATKALKRWGCLQGRLVMLNAAVNRRTRRPGKEQESVWRKLQMSAESSWRGWWSEDCFSSNHVSYSLVTDDANPNLFGALLVIPPEESKVKNWPRHTKALRGLRRAGTAVTRHHVHDVQAVLLPKWLPGPFIPSSHDLPKTVTKKAPAIALDTDRLRLGQPTSSQDQKPF
jgi:hypothetical protein